MNHPIDGIARGHSPSLSSGFREVLEMRLQPTLARRRRKRRITMTLVWGSVCALIICLNPVLSSWNDKGSSDGPIVEGPVDKPSDRTAVAHSLDELLEKHFSNPFGSNPLRGELELALAGLSAEELLEIGRKHSAGPRFQADRAASASLKQVAEQSDCIVHVRVNQAQLDRNELQRLILLNQLSGMSDSSGRLLVNFDLAILDAQAELPTDADDRLEFWTFVGYDERDKIRSGREYFLSLRHQWGRYRLSHGAYGGVYPISTDAGGAKIVTIDDKEHPIEEARKLIAAACEAARNPNRDDGPAEPTPEELADWLRKLASESLNESGEALGHLKNHSKAIPPTLLVDAIDRHYRVLRARVGDNLKLPGDEDFCLTRTFIEDAMDLLPKIIDEQNLERVLTLYKADLAEFDALFDCYITTQRITRLALAVPGPARSGRFRELYFGRTPPKHYELPNGRKRKISRRLTTQKEQAIGELVGKAGKDIDKLVLEIIQDPISWKLTGDDSVHPLAALWGLAAKRELPGAVEILAEFVENPKHMELRIEGERLDYLTGLACQALSTHAAKTIPRKERLQYEIDLYHKGSKDSNSVNRMCRMLEELLEPGDTRYLPIIRELLGRREILKLIVQRIPDPSLVPSIRAKLAKDVSVPLLEALGACGKEEGKREAVAIALRELARPPREVTDSHAIFHDNFRRAGLLSFLGKSGDASALSIVERYTRDETLYPYWDITARIAKKENGFPYDFTISGMQKSAVLALARLGGKEAIPRLKELYQHQDIYIRTLAAFSLYSLEEDCADDFVRLFAENRERGLQEIERRWFWDMNGSIEEQLEYLNSSPRIKALLEERKRSGNAP